MIRRRRPPREIAFSFDSFLDVVANVVGIILRLILVAWVGARSYKGFQLPPPSPAAGVGEVASLPEPQDPLTPELERQRAELARARAELLRQVRRWQEARQQQTEVGVELAALREHGRELASEREGVLHKAADEGQTTRTFALSLTELQDRGKKLREELEALRRAPSAKRRLRFLTPVSQPLQTEEVVFECRRGRVTLIDLGALLEEAQRDLRQKGERLRTAWEADELTSAVGPFRLRYVLERERDLLDGGLPGAAPNDRANFRFGITSWEVVPVADERGETADAALVPGSTFRRTVDALEPQQTAVTLWVYADSFPLYRRLRDYLHEHDVVVAGRPLPEGVPIASSRRGSASRGQ
jgi:hypothetical protein